MVTSEFPMAYNLDIRDNDLKHTWYKYLFVGLLSVVIHFFYKKCWTHLKFEMKNNVFDEIKKSLIV